MRFHNFTRPETTVNLSTLCTYVSTIMWLSDCTGCIKKASSDFKVLWFHSRSPIKTKHVLLEGVLFVSFTWLPVGSITTAAATVTPILLAEIWNKFEYSTDICCVVCFYVLALRQTGNLSRVYPASFSPTASIGSSPPTTLNWRSGREWMDILCIQRGTAYITCEHCTFFVCKNVVKLAVKFTASFTLS